MNLFLPADVHKRDLHQIHFQAWKKGVKSLYYCRSKSVQRAESAASELAAPASPDAQSLPHLGRVNGSDQPADSDGTAIDYEECLACQ